MKRIRRRKLLWQIFSSFLVIYLCLLLVMTWYTTSAFRGLNLERTSQDLENNALLTTAYIQDLISSGREVDVDKFCKTSEVKRMSVRVTVIKPDGQVIGDSDYQIGAMENHRTRPEIADAMRVGRGTSTRFSTTLQMEMIYTAVLLEIDEEPVAVVRMSRALTAVVEATNELRSRIIGVWLGVGVLSSLIILIISQRISRPFVDLKNQALLLVKSDLEDLSIKDTEELGGLHQALNLMVSRLQEHNSTITKQQTEVEAILASMSEAVMAVDSVGRILKMNETMARLFDISTDSRGYNVQEIIRNREFNQFVERALESNTPVVTDLTFFSPDPRYLRGNGARLRAPDGTSLGAVLVLNDVTRLKQLEDHRRDFVANVSHELRTPITSIKGFIETLLSGAIEEKDLAERFLNIMARQSERLSNIIDDLLSLSKIEHGQDNIMNMLELRPLQNDLKAAVESVETTAEKRSIKLFLDCPDDIELSLHPSLFQQAIINLIENAVKYSEENKEVHLTVQEEGDRVRINVIDQGFGIPAKHLSRLFERFYRVDKARSRDVGGTGLGLSIVKHIVQAHSGTIEVTSEMGVGSTFTISLPKVLSREHIVLETTQDQAAQ